MTKKISKIKLSSFFSFHQDYSLWMGISPHLEKSTLTAAKVAFIDRHLEGKKVSDGRWREFGSTRLLIPEVFQHFTNQPFQESLIDWNPLFHHHLNYTPYPLISLAHTKEYGAVMMAASSKLWSIGIDIENKSRIINNEAQKYFKHPNDRLDGIIAGSEKGSRDELMILWILKEAAFKALSSLWKNKSCFEKFFQVTRPHSSLQNNPGLRRSFTEPLTLSQIWVQNHLFGMSDNLADPIGYCEWEELQDDHLWLATAYI